MRVSPLTSPNQGMAYAPAGSAFRKWDGLQSGVQLIRFSVGEKRQFPSPSGTCQTSFLSRLFYGSALLFFFLLPQAALPKKAGEPPLSPHAQAMREAFKRFQNTQDPKCGLVQSKVWPENVTVVPCSSQESPCYPYFYLGELGRQLDDPQVMSLFEAHERIVKTGMPLSEDPQAGQLYRRYAPPASRQLNSWQKGECLRPRVVLLWKFKDDRGDFTEVAESFYTALKRNFKIDRLIEVNQTTPQSAVESLKNLAEKLQEYKNKGEAAEVLIVYVAHSGLAQSCTAFSEWEGAEAGYLEALNMEERALQSWFSQLAHWAYSIDFINSGCHSGALLGQVPEGREKRLQAI